MEKPDSHLFIAHAVARGNGVSVVSEFGALERFGTVKLCDEGATIYRSEEPANYWYRIVSGAARKCALRPDGRRQIIDFLFPGDMFGFAAHATRCLATEVIVPDTRVARYPRSLVERLVETDPELARQIRELAFATIARLQTRMVILGQTTALDKVGAFLLEMEDRCGGAASAITLPMSRYDIADYLAMAVETVSRALTELKVLGVIAMNGPRGVEIRDRCALERRADASWASGVHATVS